MYWSGYLGSDTIGDGFEAYYLSFGMEAHAVDFRTEHRSDTVEVSGRKTQEAVGPETLNLEAVDIGTVTPGKNCVVHCAFNNLFLEKSEGSGAAFPVK